MERWEWLHASPGLQSYLGLLLGHHVQLLLAHPRLGLCRVGVELLGSVGLDQTGVAFVRLCDQLIPEFTQLDEALLQDGLPLSVDLTLSLSSSVDVVDARLMALDLLLQRLITNRQTPHVSLFFQNSDTLSDVNTKCSDESPGSS